MSDSKAPDAEVELSGNNNAAAGSQAELKEASGGPLKRTVVLVGLMGAGKTTIGRRLASKLDVDFIDSDDEIEKAAGCSIPDIFEKYGEDEFREGERKIIKRLMTQTPCVLATGGGAFMNADSRKVIAENGLSVWLKAEIGTLLRRVSKRKNRPLLRQGDPKKIMAKLIDERYPVYAEADITVGSAEGPHDVVVQKIVEALIKADYLSDKFRASASDRRRGGK